MAIAANVLSFSDSLLCSREEYIDVFRDRMETLLSAIRRCSTNVWHGGSLYLFHFTHRGLLDACETGNFFPEPQGHR